KNEDTFGWMMGLGAFASFITLVVVLFTYPFNFMLWAAFWILLATLTIFVAKGTKTVSLAPSSFASLGASFAFLLILIFGLGLLFIGGQKYIAEVNYLKGVKASQEGDFEGATTQILRAASQSPSVDIYWRDLAQLYLSQVNRVGADTSLTDEERAQRVQVAVANAVTASQQATTINPANVANWNVRGFVYRNLIGASGAEGFALESYEEAAKLEPASPFSWTELARARVVQAQTLARQEGSDEQIGEILTQALVDLNKAIELKNDYAPAHYLVAAVYEQQGNVEEAIKKLEETKVVAAPRDVGLAFQLGLIYWRQQDLDKAQAELERAKLLDENHGNARYILGLVYDAQGDADKAIEEFVALAAANSENKELQQILLNLEQGLPALEGLNPEVPPLEETPPEISESEETSQ
ncbi:MAG: tetratricopeptide repeat protein, partial [archaeon]|nr:tetratricopeptide repeat protein [archaeon]